MSRGMSRCAGGALAAVGAPTPGGRHREPAHMGLGREVAAGPEGSWEGCLGGAVTGAACGTDGQGSGLIHPTSVGGNYWAILPMLQ